MGDMKVIDAEYAGEEMVAEKKEELAVAVREEIASPPAAANMWNDLNLMKMNMQAAKVLATASAVPDAYKNRPGDCLIAIDLSNRMGISPISIMQYSQVVKGNFTWKGQACKALIDGNNKFANSKYVMFGEPGTDEWGCRVEAISRYSGETIVGPDVTMKMAKDEGWYDKPGSKWKTMPALMLKYRAAAFFARTECPDSLMGFYTSEEMNDIKGYSQESVTGSI
jgi:hypothetical protein